MTYLGKVALDELVRLLAERLAAMLLGKVRDPDRVGRVELPLEKVTARVYHIRHLEHGGGRQQLAHGQLRHPDLAGVHEEEDARHRGRADALQLHARHLALLQAAGEHGLEVGARRGQHDLVRVERFLLHLERHVRQHVVRPHHKHHLEHLARIVWHVERHIAQILSRCCCIAGTTTTTTTAAAGLDPLDGGWTAAAAGRQRYTAGTGALGGRV